METRPTVEKVLTLDQLMQTGSNAEEILEYVSGWAERMRVITRLYRGWTDVGNRVWISAVPDETLTAIKEDVPEITGSNIVLVLYENPETAASFRSSAVIPLKLLPVDESMSPCPLECDFWDVSEKGESKTRIEDVVPVRNPNA